VNADAAYMRLAVRLGRKGLGRTAPNPPVGAVVVRAGRVLGRGFHRRAGAPHAEAEALAAAGAKARGATLFVTLAPCTHQGRTPPCSEAILAAGIRRVVVGIRDPNSSVSGDGVSRLRRSGVEVEVGVEARACEELIAAFRTYVETGLPLVTLKLAASLDGRIATGSGASQWISGPPARRLVHRLRNQTDAVLVGAGTVIRDDPSLTCRLRGGRDPLRVVVDGRLRVPTRAQVLSGAAARGTLVATASRDWPRIEKLRRRGVTVLVLPGRAGRLSVRRLLRALAARDVRSVLIEGGSDLAAAALREKAVHRLIWFFAPKLIGGDGLPMTGPLGVSHLGAAVPLRLLQVRRVGEDVAMFAEIRDARAGRRRGADPGP
jgi:diaminohydroxyphosphoribosylaminopyrimidine deaminase/5-amino-6-(5-phosphoribosylamino)uracil reductase